MEDFLDIQRDHPVLINKCLQLMKPGGIMYFSTNFRKFQLAVTDIIASNITDITKITTPFDFEGKLSRYCYKILK
jgi:23S rRNA (cytosine1962-C5)-methyltransferase